MKLELKKADLLKVSPITGSNTLQLFPVSKTKRRQKFVIGDQTGSLSGYQIKKGDPLTIFKTSPLHGPISTMTMGGLDHSSEKVFAASASEIVGFTKKGKEFFRFQSNVTEPIHSLAINDHHVWAATDFVYQLYERREDRDFYSSEDTINCMLVGQLSSCSTSTSTSAVDLPQAILGCQDKHIRVIRGSECLMSKVVSGPVTALARSLKLGTSTDSMVTPTSLVYGTSTGVIGQLVTRASSSSSSSSGPASSSSKYKLRSGWKITPAHRDAGAINCLEMYDLNENGVDEILVGRDDGQVQVYQCPDPHQSAPGPGSSSEDRNQQPKLLFEYTESESIRAIQGGIVNTQDYQDVLIGTYSGRLVSFTTENLDQPDTDDNYGRSRGTVQRETRIIKLRKELDQLKDRLKKEKSSKTETPCSSSAPPPSSSSTTTSSTFVVAPEEFHMSQKLRLMTDQAAYHLTVEIPTKLNLVMLSSTVALDLIETERNQCIVSFTPTTDDRVLATYRYQDPSSSRFELKMRTMEGQYGEVQLTLIADTPPNKSAQMIKFPIKPLSLHQRLPMAAAAAGPSSRMMMMMMDDDDDGSSSGRRPMNVLTFEGTFSIVQMHEWVASCLADVPDRVSCTSQNNSTNNPSHYDDDNDHQHDESGSSGGGHVVDPEMTLSFINTYLGTHLVVVYRKAHACFSSDNISTLAILKEVVMKEATNRKVSMKFHFDLCVDTIDTTLEAIRHKWEEKYDLAMQVNMIEALKEIDPSQDTSTSSDVSIISQEQQQKWMSPEYQTILEQAPDIRRAFEARPRALQYLTGLITDYYIDFQKFQGHQAQHRIPELHKILDQYDFEHLRAFFHAKL